MALKKLFIDANIQHPPEAQRIRRRLGLPAECVDDPVSIYQWINSAADPVGRGKQVLYELYDHHVADIVEDSIQHAEIADCHDEDRNEEGSSAD